MAVRGGGGGASGANNATFSADRTGTSLRILASESGSDGDGSGCGQSVIGSAGFSTGLLAGGTTGGLTDFAAGAFGSEGIGFSTALGATTFLVGAESACVWREGVAASGLAAGGTGGLTEALSILVSAAGLISGRGAFSIGWAPRFAAGWFSLTSFSKAAGSTICVPNGCGGRVG